MEELKGGQSRGEEMREAKMVEHICLISLQFFLFVLESFSVSAMITVIAK